MKGEGTHKGSKSPWIKILYIGFQYLNFSKSISYYNKNYFFTLHIPILEYTVFLYFLQKNDIMLHFTQKGSSDVTGFQCLLFVYLESVARYKFGFTCKVLQGINLDLNLDLNLGLN